MMRCCHWSSKCPSTGWAGGTVTLTGWRTMSYARCSAPQSLSAVKVGLWPSTSAPRTPSSSWSRCWSCTWSGRCVPGHCTGPSWSRTRPKSASSSCLAWQSHQCYESPPWAAATCHWTSHSNYWSVLRRRRAASTSDSPSIPSWNRWSTSASCRGWLRRSPALSSWVCSARTSKSAGSCRTGRTK